MSSAGVVYLIGAGPGAPDLITVRGVELIREADAVVYDSLVNPALVGLAPALAERVFVGKRGGEHRRIEQEEINQLLIGFARDGNRVVRLKGGDPFIFGRGGEEAAALAAAQIPFEIVPGVSSAIAAPAFAGIPLTHRDYGSFVAILTGHDDLTSNPAAARRLDDLARAARERGTIVILMGTARMRDYLSRLAASGLSPETPAAAIQWATTAGQRTVAATLGTLATEVEQASLGAPAVIVVGECAGLRSELVWFERMPLFGRRIVVTRAAGNAASFARQLRALGAEAIEFPTIETAPPESFETLDRALAELASFDWIIFTSATGVTSFIERLRTTGHDIRELGHASIAAIGPITARRLEAYSLRVAATPGEYRAEAIVDAIGASRIKGARILIPRATVAREILPELLTRHGAREVVVAPSYRTVVPARADTTLIRELIATNLLDLVTFTSSSTVKHFTELAGELPAPLKAAVIGPITAAAARAQGFDVVIQPSSYTVESLTAAIVEYFATRG